VAPVMGSAPRRLGELEGKFARWSPKGDRIVYSQQGSLKIASAEGGDGRELAHVNGYIEDGTWSPDGQRLRFSVSLPNSRRIWEVRADGSGLHEVTFPGWDQPWYEMGAWTPDGKYFLFSAGQSSHDLWLSREGGFEAPFRLTNGPLWDLRPQPVGEGHRVYFEGTSNIGQLVRFDASAKQWRPFLGGMDAVQVAYSKDGKWMAYADSKGRLWRSAADGSERRQLTAPPQFARNPMWSPDGQSIVFYAGAVGEPDCIYVAAASGSAVTQLTHGENGRGEGDGNWSPDGTAILYDAHSNETDRKPYLYKIDVRSRRMERLPNTARLWSPRWSPDGKLVAVLDENAHLRLYDMATQRAGAALTGFPAGYPMWSRDGSYVYFENNSSTAWYRVAVAERKVELVQRLTGLETALNSAGWVGMTPQGMLISARTVNPSNVYALDWASQ
jgi:Tol biopolymer transport system component